MSGIFAWINFPTEGDERNSIVNKMISTMRCTRDDCDGIANSEFAIYACGSMSSYAKNADKNIYVAVSGYIREEGKISNKNSANYILNKYISHGIDFLEHIYGAYSLIIIDKKSDTVYTAVDKMGIQALSYGAINKNGFIVASNNNCLIAHPGINANISLQEIYNYTYFHIIPSPNTIYENIYKLEPAQYVCYQNNNITKHYFWKPTFNETKYGDINILKKTLDSTFKNIVSRYDLNDSSGAFLSGGLDSSTVSGYLSRSYNKPLNVFSMGFSADGYDEIEYARTAAKHFSLKLHEYYVTPNDILDTIPEVAEAYDEPFGNSSAIPTLVCARYAASNGIKTMYAGDGGDEIFAGNERYATQKLFSTYTKIPDLLRKHILETEVTKKILTSNKYSKKIHRFIEHASTPMPARMQNYNFLHMFNPKSIFQQDYLESVDLNVPLNNTEVTFNQSGADSLVNKMLYLDWKLTLSDNDLRKVNKMCELADVNVIYPMLDDDLVNFSTSIHPDLKLKGLKLRHFFKYAINDFLPQTIINKPKHGFGLPFGEWLKTSSQLQESIYDNMLRLSSRNIFQKQFIEDLIERHRTGHAAYYGTMVWVLSMLEQWFISHDK